MTLPCDVFAEEVVLATLLAAPEQLSHVPDLEPDHFYAPESRHIFAAFKRCMHRDGTADAVTVHTELVATNRTPEVSISYLTRVVDRVPETINVRLHADSVLRMWRAREAVRIGQTLAALARDAGNAEEQVATALEALRSLTSQRETGVDASESIKSLFREVVDAKDRNTLDTGFETFDNATNGIPRGSMVVVAAPTGGGKTALVLNLVARMCKQGLRARYVTLEMSPNQLNGRLLCNLGDLDFSRYNAAVSRKSVSLNADEWQRLLVAAQQISSWKLEWSENGDLAHLLAQAKLQHQLRGLDVLVVDYLQQVNHPQSRSVYERVSAVSRALKQFALETKTVVFAVAQFNRNPDREKRTPQMSDLRDSGQIERDADIVGLLYPDARMGQDHVWLDVQKHRFSVPQKFGFRFDRFKQRFEESRGY